MWAIIKIDKKKLNILKLEFKLKLGKECKFYHPKIKIEKFFKNKLIKKEMNVLGDYIFVHHQTLSDTKMLNTLQFIKGLKYFLNGFQIEQKQIIKYIEECKNNENSEGYLCKNFYEICLNKLYKFNTGPFTEKIFKIIDLQKNKISILMGNNKSTISKKGFLFSPIY